MHTQPAAQALSSDRVGIVAGLGGLFATVLTGLACVGPLVAILLGIGGFGWLTRYAYLQVPASIGTGLLLAGGFGFVYGRPTACKHKGRQRASVWLLWIATVLAVAVNVFEYLIFPHVL
jgi:hypothetical protein